MGKTKLDLSQIDKGDRDRNAKKRARRQAIKDGTYKPKPINNELKPNRSKDPKRIRARARRRMKLAEEDLALLPRKPIEEWDEEELARGRVRDKNGGWAGARPKWIDTATHEEAVKRMQGMVREGMNVHTFAALDMIRRILDDEEVDSRGKPRTPASVKLDASKFLIEHVVGKPKQHQEVDISVRLQSVLADAMITGSGTPVRELTEGITDAEVVEDDDEDEDGDD